MVTIHTDGSADNITGTGGWAAVVHDSSRLIELVGFAKSTTSNRMEMTAAIEGLKALTVPSEVTLISDSSYLLNCFKNKWYERWLEQEIEGGHKPRPNMDLWHQLIGLQNFHTVHWVKVKGHAGHYWNERVDRLAGSARKEELSHVYDILDWVEGLRCEQESRYKQCLLHRGHMGGHAMGGKENKKAYGSDSQSH